MNGLYVLDAEVSFRLSQPVRAALHKGVKLVFELQIQVVESLSWLPDSIVAELSQRFRLEYHALSRQYVVENLNTGIQRSYPDFAAAMAHIGRFSNLPLIDASLLTPGDVYYCRIRATLDQDALPLPLRIRSYLASEWRLNSGWREVRMQ